MLRVVSEAQGASKHLPLYISSASKVAFGPEFLVEERDEEGTFRWMGLEARLMVEPQAEPRFLEFGAFSEFQDLSQELAVQAGDKDANFRLGPGWRALSVELPAGVSEVHLQVNKLFPREYYPHDERSLAIRVRSPKIHADPDRHRDLSLQQKNTELNISELMQGATVLSSTPQVLGIDMYGVCNVKPPCVYCDWDNSKVAEGDNVDTPFDVQLLGEWGEFFDNSSMLVNCSIGEPFMMKNFDELLDVFGHRGKFLELTTNGQILTDRNIEKLLGRNINLYISLDAATPETYAKLRNDKFERILGNLRRLVKAKGGKNGLPRIFLVFMPMKVNQHELEDFVRLCADLGVDRLILRPLCFYEESGLVWDRAGYTFNYLEELLPWEELVRISGRAAQLCEELGVELSDQLDFGGSLEQGFQDDFSKGRDDVKGLALEDPGEATAAQAGEGAPAELTAGEGAADSGAGNGAEAPAQTRESDGTGEAEETSPETPLPVLGHEKMPPCLEPWTNLYILRRGITPCCYGAKPIAEMDGYREIWNSQLMQDIRGDLAQGKFHSYCHESTSCPIIRKAKADDTLGNQPISFQLRMKRLLLQVDRLAFGLPKKLYKATQRATS